MVIVGWDPDLNEKDVKARLQLTRLQSQGLVTQYDIVLLQHTLEHEEPSQRVINSLHVCNKIKVYEQAYNYLNVVSFS